MTDMGSGYDFSSFQGSTLGMSLPMQPNLSTAYFDGSSSFPSSIDGGMNTGNWDLSFLGSMELSKGSGELDMLFSEADSKQAPFTAGAFFMPSQAHTQQAC